MDSSFKSWSTMSFASLKDFPSWTALFKADQPYPLPFDFKPDKTLSRHPTHPSHAQSHNSTSADLDLAYCQSHRMCLYPDGKKKCQDIFLNSSFDDNF
ncbi:hypothetical protein BgiMline_031699 [Biomphalaria glabrata]|nr:hypothetical protein BgiMline_019915 [Biomphalaria glabrata]